MGIFAGERHSVGAGGPKRESSRPGRGKKHQMNGFCVVVSAVMKDRLRCDAYPPNTAQGQREQFVGGGKFWISV